MESLAPRKETWIRAEREGNDALPVAEAGDLGDRSFATSEPASDLKEEVKGFVYGRSGGVDGSGLDGGRLLTHGSLWRDGWILFALSAPFLPKERVMFLPAS
ncbi:hypothetical protein C4D60_Mb04t24580 [Musa balbisiana]|uniref:Uncharacterized protein n=1 Tax=Musa balbisiana TaxID=52838 RepID=A0A4S8KED9_MUSBA|nr:hypothetical protein C4D60_Mb04t24580 [Musa balbisiana]